MTTIDYSTIFSGITMTTDDDGNFIPISSAKLVSFPFKDPDPHDDWLWFGEEGFHRFLDFVNPRAMLDLGYINPDIYYMQQIITEGLAAINIGTVTNPNWVGSLVSNGFDPRKSYWVKFNDDLDDLINSWNDNLMYHNNEFFDFHLSDGVWDIWRTVDWAFASSSNKTLTGELIEPTWKLRNVGPGKAFFVAYPFGEDSASTSQPNEFGFKYPDSLYEDVIGTSVAATYVEGSSAWGGSLTHLEPGKGYILVCKPQATFTESDLEADDSVQLYEGEAVPSNGITWYDLTQPSGKDQENRTYDAANYSYEEVTGQFRREHQDPEGFAGYVNWGYHPGTWNPETVPAEGAINLYPGFNNGYLQMNGILNSDFSNWIGDNEHHGNSFWFTAFYDPYRDEHFTFQGFRYGLPLQNPQSGDYCGSDEEYIPEGNVEPQNHNSVGFFNSSYIFNENINSVIGGNTWYQTYVNNYATDISVGVEAATQNAFWTEDASTLGTLHRPYAKQRQLLLGNCEPTGFGLKFGFHMPWTWVCWHAPNQKFYQLRPAHIRYKILDYSGITSGMSASDSVVVNPDNLQKVMYFWMDNHRTTYETASGFSLSINDEYSGSDTLDPSAVGYGWRGFRGIACGWGDTGTGTFIGLNTPFFSQVDSDGNIQRIGSSAPSDWPSATQVYLEVPMQLVCQASSTVNWWESFSEITTGPFERDIDKTVEAG